MWAVNKQYWYRGDHLFDAKGANIYTKPTLEMQPGVEPAELEPVDVKAMLRRTSDLMFVLENEAIEFIRDYCCPLKLFIQNKLEGVSKVQNYPLYKSNSQLE